MKKNTEKVPFTLGVSPKRLAISVFAGLLLTLGAILLFAQLISSDALSPERMGLCSAVSVGLGGVLASFLTGGKRKKLITALITAACLFLLLILIGALAFGGIFSIKLLFLILIILIVSCIIGSVASGLIT